MAGGFARFSAFVAEKEPKILDRHTSADGFQFVGLYATSMGWTVIARFDDVEPYAYGLLHNVQPRFIEFCEGDVTLYEFADHDDAEEAARIYGQSDIWWAAAVAADRRNEDEDESLGSAIVMWIRDYSVGEVDESNVEAALEKYRGKFESDAAYAEETVESYGLPSFEQMLPQALADVVQLSIDWDDTSLCMKNTQGWNFFEHRGHYFEEAD